MKKNIEWLKEKVKGEYEYDRVKHCKEDEGYAHREFVFKYVLGLLDQLDEPEVLSQGWIEDNTFVVTDEDGDDYAVVENRKLKDKLVPKQDLPVVPAWFHEWWKDVPRGAGSLFHNIERFHDELFSSGTREEYNYISDPDNKQKLLNIIINESGYKVEEEQKYFVSSRESVGFWFLSKNNDNEVVIGTNKDYYDRKWESLKLTEQEIKDYDSRYWAFATPVEEVE